MTIDEFNRLDKADARHVVSVWAAIPAWVDAVVAARPYRDVDGLARIAAAGARGWTVGHLDAALAHHPRIGERATGSGAEAAASRSEQSSMTDATAGIAERIAAGNVRYEQRFGRVFLIRAAGRSPEEMLSELERRLANDSEAETAEALRQLSEIALLRLRADIGSAAAEEVAA